MNAPRITYSRHAEEVLAERNIEQEWVERTIRNPDATEPDAAHRDVSQAFKSIPERNGRVLRVVYATRANQIRVITVFFDRARRRR